MIRVLENEFYYLDNFQRVLDWIGERYGDLLDEAEHAFLAAFPLLPRNARALFVRMVMRIVAVIVALGGLCVSRHRLLPDP